MSFEIPRHEVMNNLIRFKENLSQMRGQTQEGERTYQVLLNQKTGRMRFPQKIRALEHHIAKRTNKETVEEWKEVRIVVRQNSRREPVHFELLDTENHSLKSSDLEPLSWRVTKETLAVLNQKVKEVKRSDMLPEEAALQDLSSIQFELQSDGIETLPGWMGSLNRIEAEVRLTGKMVGTYLIRDGDEITLWMSFQFAEENHLYIRPYLLTVVETEEKISDILLLKTDKGWILYNDDPNLADEITYHYYPSPQSLVRSLHKIATNPLM